MKRTSFADRECPIAQALEQLGDAWNLLILRDLLLAPRFFCELERSLEISASTLTRRLSRLEADGLVERRSLAAEPPREHYAPTGKARELLPLFVGLAGWSNRWLAGEGREHMVFVEAASGLPVNAELRARRGRKAVSPSTVRLVAGPAASDELREQLAHRPRSGVARVR